VYFACIDINGIDGDDAAQHLLLLLMMMRQRVLLLLLMAMTMMRGIDIIVIAEPLATPAFSYAGSPTFLPSALPLLWTASSDCALCARKEPGCWRCARFMVE